MLKTVKWIKIETEYFFLISGFFVKIIVFLKGKKVGKVGKMWKKIGKTFFDQKIFFHQRSNGKIFFVVKKL